ncbi:ABC transporter substrate-binding protein [Frankia nepalensis]|uniref:ABC transporter substrate-binding protein n=1 Tax=Frankia nepalensis TaxID=1836974 RepID=UPI0027DE4897|nr:ABC transporter substrate-binding protein [Frankia nepalensis]
MSLAASLLLVTACGGSDDDGSDAAAGTPTDTTSVLGPLDKATGTPVRIGLISDDKGPVSDLAIETAVAKATVTYINEHKGGIAGHPIELVVCKAFADPAVGTDCANQMVEEDVTAVLVGSSSVPEAIWEPLHGAHMPVLLAYAAGAPTRDTESTFAMADTTYVLQALLQLAKSEGAKKVTAVAIDVPATRIAWTQLAPAQFKAANIELEFIPIPPGTADMTPQMQPVANGDADIVHVVGNDAFCIAAFKGLQTGGYTGTVLSHPNCLSDRTRSAVSGDFLEGMVLPGLVPIGHDNPSTRLYEAVVAAYGKDIDTHRVAGLNMFSQVTAFELGADGVTGEVTQQAIITAFKTMPEKDLPGATGLKFRCNGKAVPATPAICTRGWLMTTLDGEGQPTGYKPVGVTPIEG